MSRARNIVSLVALIAIVLVGLSLLIRSDRLSRDQGSNSSVAATEDGADSPSAVEHMNPKATEPDPEYSPPDEDAGCVTMDQLETDPVILAEYERFDSLVTSGPTIESYRGLSSADLAGLANQGDSAAMAVLGAISVMRAMGLPEDEAVPFLLLEGISVQSFDFRRPLQPETEKNLEEARDWFYKAAVHGRLMALQNAGEIIAIVDGTPPDLGWIQQEEYESLASYERQGLDPTNVYGALAFEIAPELRNGPLGAMMSDLIPGGERQQLVLNELAWRFAQDREAANLQPIAISASTALSEEEIEAMLFCYL